MQQTSKYQFKLIEGTDDFSPTPLNDNMEKVEVELSELDTALAQGLEEVEEDLAGVMANLGTAGKNARITWGTYTGTGTYGAGSPNSLNVGFYPVLVVVGCSENTTYANWPTVLIRGCPTSNSDLSHVNQLLVTWQDNGVQWYCTDHGQGQNNASGDIYYYCVIGYDKNAV